MSAIVKASQAKIVEPGEMLFMEGDQGDEMYIIKRGQIQILKREGARMVQLATLGPGSVIGELSLLDQQPRSASARALNMAELVVINQATLQSTYKKIPTWLTSLIKMLVTRLRDTNKRKHLNDLRFSLPIVLKIILTLNQEGELSFKSISKEIFILYGMSETDLKKVLKLLKLFQFIDFGQDQSFTSQVVILQEEALIQYLAYLECHLQSKTHPWSELKDEDLLRLQLLVDTAKKRGSQTQGRLKFNHQNLQHELEAQQIPATLFNDDDVKKYQDLGLLEIDAKLVETTRSSHNHSFYFIDEKTIQSVIRFQTRLDYFVTNLDDYFLM